MSQYDEDVIVEDPELDEELDTEASEDIETAERRREEEQLEFLTEVRSVMESQLEAHPGQWPVIESTAEGILNLIEGAGEGDGYVLIKRNDMTEGLLPCTASVYEAHLIDYPDTTPVDISSGLLMAFEDINS